MADFPKFPTSPNYPSAFRRQPLDDQQSAVTSQFSPVPPPFDPSHNPDLQSIPPSVAELSIVRANFDSRPPRGFDFYWRDAFLQGVNQLGGYTCPPGYVMIIREIVIQVYPAETNDGLHTYGLDLYGGSFVGVDFRFLVDGANSPFFTYTQGIGGVKLYNFYSQDICIPSFILINQNSNFNIQIPFVTDDPTVNVMVEYYGNYLFSTGRNLINEVGNANPLLTQTAPSNMQFMGISNVR